MGCENSLVLPCILLQTDMHKTWVSMVAFSIGGLLSCLHVLGAATHPRVLAGDT